MRLRARYVALGMLVIACVAVAFAPDSRTDELWVCRQRPGEIRTRPDAETALVYWFDADLTDGEIVVDAGPTLLERFIPDRLVLGRRWRLVEYRLSGAKVAHVGGTWEEARRK